MMTEMRQAEECTFTTHDGEQLFYRHWPAVSAKRRGAIVLFHRGHEHSGRMAHLVDEFDLPDFEFFAWDARGHGKSPGVRGFSPSLGASVRDVQTFVDHIQSEHSIDQQDIAVVAQSVGAVLAATWVHDYAPKVRSLVLASPAFKVKLYVPFARPGLRLMHALFGNFFVNSYVKAKFLTHDKARQESYDADPLIARAISVNILLGLYDAADRIVADAHAITVPTQLLVSGADWVVHHKPQYDFFEKLGSSVKEMHVLDDFYHDTLGEADRQKAIIKSRDFILRTFAVAPSLPDLRAADKQGFTHDESKALSQPLPLFSPRGMYWGLMRLNMKVGGWISTGIKLGHATGFDSGSTLDYVYRNHPEGSGFIGRMADSQYLNSIGWRGIRQRKLHLEELLRKAMGKLSSAGRPVRVLDIAAGHGRYVMEALTQDGLRPESILLRDFSDINVRDGAALIREKGLEGIASFVNGDAFDRTSIASISPKPSIGIVSGLYELFPENDAVRRSLAGMADAIEPGGYLLYTNQPWHPQLELIARALTSHRGGQAWVMRRRTQVEMDQLVAEAGFEKVAQRIDEWGIFTVSMARRIAA
jgi:alpha-beta hydrolase superfamily lysophospholipase/SAM-dependent methyltransferase